MDLNYLYFRQQVAFFMADNAGCEQSRRAHSDMADRYGKRIAKAKAPSQGLAGWVSN